MLKIATAAGILLAVLSTGAFAADLAPGVVSEPAPAGWSGAYAGVNIGYGPGTLSDPNGDEDSDAISFSGAFYGAQVGYNFSMGNGFVIGLEGDLNGASESGSVNETDTNDCCAFDPITQDDYEYNDSYSTTSKLNWSGAVTGRVGYAWESIMPYALAGIAIANNTVTDTETQTVPDDTSLNASSNDSSTATHMGWTIGGGFEAMLTSNLSGFIEGRYSDYGSATYTYGAGLDNDGSGSYVTKLTDTAIRTGINFHF